MAKSARTNAPRSPLPPPTSQPRTPWRQFVRESWAELRKVQWPTRQHVAQGTLVVGVVTVFFAIYLSLVDQVAVRLVKQVDKWLTG